MLAAFDHSDFKSDDLLAQKAETVSVCIPTQETAERIGNTVKRLLPLREAGLIDELLVIDSDSSDGTADLARDAGATVYSENSLMPDFGPCRGKGDAMWRALSIAGGEIVMFIDGDVADIGAHYVVGLLGPLFTRPELSFVKGFYDRPFDTGEREIPAGGGRVTELTAKPLLALTAPELAHFRQPLAGELAGRRDLMRSIPFLTGYGVETAMLFEVWAKVGVKGMAEVDLGSKRNDHQSLIDLGRMAREVTEAVAISLERHQGTGLGTLRSARDYDLCLESRPPLEQALRNRGR